MAACSSQCFWWGGDWRSVGGPWPTALGACARWRRPSCATRCSLSWERRRRACGNWRCSDCWRAWASAESGRWAACLSRRSGPRPGASKGAAYMHTGYYFGVFLAAIVNYVVGTRFGWRAVFAVGGAPALLVAFIRYGVSEPKRWQRRVEASGRRWTARAAFVALFSTEYRKRTVVNAALVLVSMVGLWAGSVYAPSAVTYLATRGAIRQRMRRAWHPTPRCCLRWGRSWAAWRCRR